MQTFLNAISNQLSAGDAVGAAPEFVHLVPAGAFTGLDGRGPFEAGDAAALITRSMVAGRKLPIDINHAIDHQGKKGEQTPAVGWIVAMERRADGIWGRVEWTDDGARLVGGRAYGYLSPVFTASRAKPHRLIQVLRASLTNDPNLILTALHSRTGDPDMEEQLRTALGLPETADQGAILAAVTASLNASTAAATTMARLAEAAGLDKNASAEAVITALQTRTGNDPEKDELRGEIRELNTRLTAEVTARAKERAETVIDKAIEDGRVVPALRDRFIARHMKEPAEVEAEIKLMPQLNSGGLAGRRRVDPGAGQLGGTDAAVCELMGLDPKQYAATLAAMDKEKF